MELKDLEIYRRAREISARAWEIYIHFDWQTKKISGDQWIESVDSIGANIAEGFGRFHFLDKNKFTYQARGSLTEAHHWTDLLYERKKMTNEQHQWLSSNLQGLLLQMNSYVRTTKYQVRKQTPAPNY